MKKHSAVIIIILSQFITMCTNNNNPVSEEENITKNAIDISLISIDSLMSYAKILSGRSSFYLNAKEKIITSRHRDSDGNDLSAEFIEMKLKQFGYTVENQLISTTCRNVIAVHQGSETNKFFVLGAHYDSTSPVKSEAPGADDNASGVCVVLEAARVLKNSSPKYSIVYAFWDEEELSADGSKYFGNNAKSKGEEINLVLNVDMVAYDSDNDGTIGLYKPVMNGLDTYINKIEQMKDFNNLGLNLKVVNRAAYSDDYILSEQGHKTLGFVEVHFDSTFTDFNKYWHTTGDTVDKFNVTFFENNAKLIISSLAYFSETSRN